MKKIVISAKTDDVKYDFKYEIRENLPDIGSLKINVGAGSDIIIIDFDKHNNDYSITDAIDIFNDFVKLTDIEEILKYIDSKNLIVF